MSELPDHGPAIRIPPPLVFVTAFGVGWYLDTLLPIEIAHILQTPVFVIAATVILVAGLCLTFWALAVFSIARTAIFPNRSASELVVTGPYSISRNPMYLGLTIAYASGAILVNSWWPLFFLPLVMWVVSKFIILREEQHLETRFGLRYLDYKSRVRRWL